MTGGVFCTLCGWHGSGMSSYPPGRPAREIIVDGLGALRAPAGAGDAHPVLDQVAAGALDDAGGDRPAGEP
jgi:hypothetical protein